MKQQLEIVESEQVRRTTDQDTIPMTISQFEVKLKEIGAEIVKPSEVGNSEVVPHDPIAVKDGKVVAFWIK